MRIAATIVVSVLALGWAHAGSVARSVADLPNVGPPPQGQARWIARHMRLNGLPMTLQAFESRLAPQDVLHYYESWAKNLSRSETRRSMDAPWFVLAIKARCCYITIRARTIMSGSEGTVAVSAPLERARLNIRTSFPRPPSAAVVNLQEYEDLDVASEHIAMTSTRSPTVEARAFAQLLAREGWTLTSERRTRKVEHGHVLEAQKGAQHALVTLLPDRERAAGTAIVVVWRRG